MELLDIFTEGKQYRKQVWELYEEAFPKDEKKPVFLIEELAALGKMEVLAVTEDNEFLGLAINMITEDIALLDYFAITRDKRSGGYGGRAIRALNERFCGKKYIYEIEIQDEHAPNALDRKRRKAFYLRNGLKETGLFVNAYKTDFEILTPDGSLAFEEYIKILTEILGEGISVLNPVFVRQE